jgi:REP element-mobilizing transposase RayT
MTCDDPGMHRRRSIRLPGYDYAQPGAYFVTICIHGRECVLGEVVDDRVTLSPFGEVVDECWRDLPSHFPGFLLDWFVVMPNHVHGIIVLVGATPASPLRVDPHASPLPAATPAHGPRPGSVGAIVGSFKSATTRRVNRIRGTPGASFWQRGYYEHVIRDEGDLEKIRTYVAQNPLSWELDENCLDHLRER